MATANITVKALLLNIGVLEASVNLRRMLSTASLNYQSPNNAVSKSSRTVAPSGTATFNAENLGTALTMLRCTGGPVTAVVTLLANGVDRLVDVDVSHKVVALLILDDTVGKVVVTNESAVDTVSLTFVQG